VSADYTQDVLEGLASDPRPCAVDDRVAIAAAITATAADRRGLVHAAGIRKHLDDSVSRRYVGVVVNRLRYRGALVFTGRYEANGDNSRRAKNGSKASPVWRLVRPITPEDIR